MDRIKAIEQRINESLSPTHLQVIDDSHLHRGHTSAGGAGHFTVHIVSEAFKDKPLIQRHRLVYEAVDDLMQTEIHALSIQAKTSEED